MQLKSSVILEARVSVTGTTGACCTCGIRKVRIPGATETYVAGTTQWVCADCSFGMDAELARFAYDPGDRPERKQRFKGDIFDAYFGICPECGNCDGRKNIGSSHWLFCERHGLKWCAGANWLDDWRNESEEQWYQNVLFLQRLRHCDPGGPEPGPRERFVQWLRGWRRVFRRRPAPTVADADVTLLDDGMLF